MDIKTPTGSVALPDSVRTLANNKQVLKEFTNEQGRAARLSVEIRWDDCCKNGHNTFAITATESEYLDRRFREVAGGCLHDRIAKYAPELAFAIPYHLFGSDGPMYYFANTTFHAGNRDCWGSAAGEQRKSRETNLPLWQLPVSPFTIALAVAEPEPYQVGFEPVLSDGKLREFEKARSLLKWPEVTCEQLSLPEPELRTLISEQCPGLDAMSVTNAVYFASNLDFEGLRQGEQKRAKNGLRKWRMTKSPFKYVESDETPEPVVLHYQPILGEGKEREFGYARMTACWPGATDAQLCLPKEQLEQLLSARLPALMAEFKAIVEKLGFVY